MGAEDPDSSEAAREHNQREARRRQRERTERVERTIGPIDNMLSEHKYPVTSEELAVEYADQELDLPNETETLGSVFDRLVDERFDSPEEAREAILHELSGEEAGVEEYDEGRSLPSTDEVGEPEPEPVGEPAEELEEAESAPEEAEEAQDPARESSTRE